MEKKLGKLANVRFGNGGYDEAMFGFSCTLDMDGTACGDFRGTWTSPPTSYAEWTVEDQRNHFADTVQFLIDIMKQAKVKEVHQLNGIPIEVTLGGLGAGKLESWRILEEVL